MPSTIIPAPVRAVLQDSMFPDITPFQRRVVFGIAITACLVRLFFWAYTDRTWEDALITVLHSENFARGLGLTHYHPGQPRIHGFTSPLSVLIPLAADLIHVGWGLPFLKLVSALIAIPTIVLAAAVASHRDFHLNIWLVYMLCGYLAFEHHQILWGMAGMETQVAVFVLFLTMYTALIEAPTALGISMGLCLYARPDFAIFLLPVTVYLLVAKRSIFIRTLAIGAGLYAPWLIFTTLYYGSPVPHTIIAKSAGYELWSSHTALFSPAFWTHVWARIYDWIFLPLGPAYSGHGSGFLKFSDDGFISRLCVMLILAGAVAMLFRFHKFYIIPLGSFIFYSIYYVYFVPALFGWYLIPFSAVNCLLLVLGLGAFFDSIFLPVRIGPLSVAVCIAYLLPFIWIMPVTFKGERDIQLYIEDPVRKAIGQYLFTHKKPGETVGSESLGYIAYYSRMPVYDYPGLANVEVANYLKQHPDRHMLSYVLEHFRPDWMALRRHEFKEYSRRPDMQFMETDYQIEQYFHTPSDKINQIFRSGQNIDMFFYLLKKGHPMDQVPLKILGPVLTDGRVSIQGAWKVDGYDQSIGRLPVAGTVYGSWLGSDANVGTIRLGPFHMKDQRTIAIPLAAGPDSDGLSVKVLNAKTGQLIASLNPARLRSQWWAWSVALPPDPDPVVEILAEDAGTKWGQWMAIGTPHSVYEKFPALGPMLPADGIKIQGAWKMDGQDPSVGRPPVDGPIYGSWIQSDANVGTIHLGPFHTKEQATVGIPLVTGPGDRSGLSVKVLDSKSGRVIASLNPVPMRNYWWVWNVALPANANIEVIAEDAGAKWGQWMAIGFPHTFSDRK